MAWKTKPQPTLEIKQGKPEYNRLYNNDRWRAASKQYRAEHPLCAECERHGVVKPAECVDHIEPHKGNLELFWSVDNWQSLCNACHSSKSARERSS